MRVFKIVGHVGRVYRLARSAESGGFEFAEIAEITDEISGILESVQEALERGRNASRGAEVVGQLKVILDTFGDAIRDGRLSESEIQSLLAGVEGFLAQQC